MSQFVSIILMIGCGVLCVYSIWKLVTAVIDRRKKKKELNADNGEDTRKEN